nr:hypothetical protein [Polycyclovorans algicola]
MSDPAKLFAACASIALENPRSVLGSRNLRVWEVQDRLGFPPELRSTDVTAVNESTKAQRSIQPAAALEAMQITDYQAKYFAYELTRRHPPDSIEKLAGAVAGAQVDLNPHQVDAALFAFQSPLSKGALLADEVGLGKTIEPIVSDHFGAPHMNIEHFMAAQGRPL